MSKKLFVGNLPTSCSSIELRKLFETVGQVVECDVVRHYGFVHMGSETECQEAVTLLDQSEFMGNYIHVQFSSSTVHKHAEEGGSKGDKCFTCGRSGHLARECPENKSDKKVTKKLFVGNLPLGCESMDLGRLFANFGQVTECDVMGSYGFVHMGTVEEAQYAVQSLDGYSLFGSNLRVQHSTNESRKNSVPVTHKATKKLFVGNLADGCNAGDVRTLFETVGQVVECDIIKNYGFVHMASESEGQAAVTQLDQAEFMGNIILVKFSTSAIHRQADDGGKGGTCFKCGKSGHFSRECNRLLKKVFVGNLPLGCANSDLRELFETVGKVEECDAFKNYGFVHMGTVDEAEQAVQQLNGRILFGSKLRVQRSTGDSHKQAPAPEPAKPTKKLFVGNLADTCTTADLRALFAKVGEVEECDVLKNYGFVHMASESEGEAAVSQLDRSEFLGNIINVKFSVSSVHKATGVGSKGECFLCGKAGHFSRDCRQNKRGDGGPEVIMAKKLFVGNLPTNCKSADLRKLFQTMGQVEECDVIKNYGFVHMASYREALEAIKNLDGHKMSGNAIWVQHSRTDKKKSDIMQYRGQEGYGSEYRPGSAEMQWDREYYGYPLRRGPPRDPYYEDAYGRRPPPFPYGGRGGEYPPPPPQHDRSRSPPLHRRPLTPPRYRKQGGSPPQPPRGRGYPGFPPADRFGGARNRFPPSLPGAPVRSTPF